MGAWDFLFFLQDNLHARKCFFVLGFFFEGRGGWKSKLIREVYPEPRKSLTGRICGTRKGKLVGNLEPTLAPRSSPPSVRGFLSKTDRYNLLRLRPCFSDFVLPARLQNLVSEFVLICCREVWREFWQIFSDPQNKGVKLRENSEHFS